MLLFSLLLSVAEEGTRYASQATGAEWLIFASIIVPAVLLGVLAFISRNTTVSR